MGCNGMEQLFFYHGNPVVSGGLWFLGTSFESMEIYLFSFETFERPGSGLERR